MSSVASIFGQKAREAVGLASRTSDETLSGLSGRLGEMEKDVQTLRGVLGSMARVLVGQLPAVRLQASNVVNELYGKLVPSGSPSMSALSCFNDAHEILDKTTPSKLQTAFQKAVLDPIEDWARDLADIRAALTEVENKRVVFDHYSRKVRRCPPKRFAWRCGP